MAKSSNRLPEKLRMVAALFVSAFHSKRLQYSITNVYSPDLPGAWSSFSYKWGVFFCPEQLNLEGSIGIGGRRNWFI